VDPDKPSPNHYTVARGKKPRALIKALNAAIVDDLEIEIGLLQMMDPFTIELWHIAIVLGVQRKGSVPFTPPSAVSSTSNATSSHAARSEKFGPKRPTNDARLPPPDRSRNPSLS
jgi:hypothetical protein